MDKIDKNGLSIGICYLISAIFLMVSVLYNIINLSDDRGNYAFLFMIPALLTFVWYFLLKWRKVI